MLPEPASSWRTLLSLAISSSIEAMMLFKSMVLVYRPPTIKRDQGREAGCFPELLHTTGALTFFKAASIAGWSRGLAESP